MEKSSRVPCILHMDSLRGSHKGLKDLFQRWVSLISLAFTWLWWTSQQCSWSNLVCLCWGMFVIILYIKSNGGIRILAASSEIFGEKEKWSKETDRIQYIGEIEDREYWHLYMWSDTCGKSGKRGMVSWLKTCLGSSSICSLFISRYKDFSSFLHDSQMKTFFFYGKRFRLRI